MTETSNFKLDDRIKSIDDIQTIIHNDLGFIGCKGFFFDEFIQTKDLTECDYGTLVDINGDNDDHCFKARDKNGNERIGYYRFFIPEKLLKPIEKKKYRPYKNVQDLFGDIGVYIGDTIHFRSKSKETEHHALITSYITLKNGTEKLCLGGTKYYYTMQELFDLFELHSRGEWQPFGVEVEDVD